MKTTVYSRLKSQWLWVAALMISTTPVAFSQVLHPAVAYEDITPSGTGNLGTDPSCYSFANMSFGSGPTYDLYISGYDGWVEWRATNPGSPGAIVFSGNLSLPNTRDVDVGIMQDGTTGLMAIVNFYQMGVGHFNNVYKWTPGGLFLIASNQYTSLTNYTESNSDFHKTYGMLTVWEENNRIYVITGSTLSGSYTFGSPTELLGTLKHHRPGVAFSHTNSGLNAHFVYQIQSSAATVDIKESVFDWNVLTTSPPSVPPTIEDVNTVVTNGNLIATSIDCPDHYPVENWAYTYSPFGNQIEVRLIDYNSLGTPITANVTNGSLVAPMQAKEIKPCIAYNQSCVSFHVGWYSSWIVGSFGQCWYDVEVKESGMAVISNPDYLLVANNSSFPPGAGPQAISYSRQNDASNFMYATFVDMMGNHHAFHKWPMTSNFKTASGNTLNDNCGSHLGHAVTGHAAELNIGPNPFTSSIQLQIPADYTAETMTVRVMDITGKRFLDYSGTAANANQALQQAAGNLSEGTYIVNANIPSKGVEQNFKIQKIANR